MISVSVVNLTQVFWQIQHFLKSMKLSGKSSIERVYCRRRNHKNKGICQNNVERGFKRLFKTTTIEKYILYSTLIKIQVRLKLPAQLS